MNNFATAALIINMSEMNITDRSLLRPEMNVAELVGENPSLLLLLEHFGIKEALNENSHSFYKNEKYPEITSISTPLRKMRDRLNSKWLKSSSTITLLK